MPTQFRIKIGAAKLRKAPDSAEHVLILGPADVLTKLAEQGGGVWWNMQLANPGVAPVAGWIKAELLAPLGGGLTPLNLQDFVAQAEDSARVRGVNRDYLLAVAEIESGIANKERDQPPGIGPFMFGEAVWSSVVNRHPELQVQVHDRANPQMQAIVAAQLTKDNQDALAASFEPKRLPSGAELYLAHWLGSACAVAVLRAGTSAAIGDPIRIHYSGASDGQAEFDRLVKAYDKRLRNNGAFRTVAEVMTGIEDELNSAATAALAKASPFLKLSTHAPGPIQGEPPWLGIARTEFARGITEFPGNSANPEILKYFDFTRLETRTDETPWCAAFVAYCVGKAVDPTATKGTFSARAADWLQWGFATGRPVIGSVAVTKPLSANSSGHVAFVIGEDGTHIQLLGGNQSNAVTDQLRVKKADVRSFQWRNP